MTSTFSPTRETSYASRRAAGARPRLRRALTMTLWAGTLSLVSGLVLLNLAEAPTKWFVFLCLGLVLAVGAIATDVRRALLAYCILALSIDAHYYLTPPPVALYTGSTSPGALSIPLSLVPALALLAMRGLLRPGARLRLVPEFSRPALAVVATALVSTALGPMRFIGFCVVWQLACLVALFLIVCNEVRSEADRELVLRTLMLALVGQAGVFFLQLATGVKFSAVGHVMAVAADDGMWHRATGTAASTTAGFATFMDPLVTLAFARFRLTRSRRERWVYGSLALLGGLIVVLTLNRSSFVALPLGLAVTELLIRRRVASAAPRARGRVLAVAAAAATLAIGLALVQAKRGTNLWDDLDQRVALMRPGFSMIASDPVFGVGPGVYAYELRNHAVGWQGWLYISHNDYLLTWAERGTLGFGAFLLWIVATMRLFLRSAGPTSTAVAVGAAGGFAAHLWEIFWTAGMSFPAYGVIYVLAALSARPQERPTGARGLGSMRGGER